MSENILAKSYIHYWDSFPQKNSDYFHELQDLVDSSPEEALAVMDTIIQLTNSDKVLQVLGAGELENLLNRADAENYIDEILLKARKIPKWRVVLLSIYPHAITNLVIRNRIKAIVGDIKK